MAQLADLINSSKKVALFCGIGCADAHDEVVALADKLKSPVGHSYRGKSFVEYDNPFDVGMSGLLGFGAACQAMHECDLLLLLGTDFPYDKFLPTKPKIVQVEKHDTGSCRRFLSRICPHVHGDWQGTRLAPGDSGTI
ncbi:MAG TPA: hypothetical protein VF845_00990 [Terriglobales bacterium]